MSSREPLSRNFLQQVLVFSAELLRATLRRHTRHASYIIGRIWRNYRPAHLPLYALGAFVAVAVVVLVMTAWLRVMMPYILTRDAPQYLKKPAILTSFRLERRSASA
jgi:hypothetical protein